MIIRSVVAELTLSDGRTERQTGVANLRLKTIREFVYYFEYLKHALILDTQGKP